MSRTVYYDWQGNEIDPPHDEPVPMTNGDVIRSMSDYDLADWIAKVLFYHDICARSVREDCNHNCPLYDCCNDQLSDNIEDWLKSPAEASG